MKPEDLTANRAVPADFGDDDLGRLQGILFGDHAKRTNERIETLEKALLGAIHDLRESVMENFAAIDSRLTSEADIRAKAVANVSEQVKEESRIRERAEKILRSDLDESYEATTQAIDSVEQRVSQSLDETRSQLSAEIQAGLASLGDEKVASDDIVKALVRAAEDIAGQRES